MKGIRFYLEYDTPAKRRKGEHSGNVFAAFVCNGRAHNGGYDGLGALTYAPNSIVDSVSADAGYLRRCKRISEKDARSIHPRLFAALGVTYKVAIPRNRWKRGFATVEEASAYASQVHRATGVFVAVEVDA